MGSEAAHKVRHLWDRKKKKHRETKGLSVISGLSDGQRDSITFSIADSVRAAFQKTRFRKRKSA